MFSLWRIAGWSAARPESSRFRLAGAEYSGATTPHGPVSATVNAPAAVTLVGFEVAADCSWCAGKSWQVFRDLPTFALPNRLAPATGHSCELYSGHASGIHWSEVNTQREKPLDTKTIS